MLECLGVFHTVHSDVLHIEKFATSLLHSLALNVNGTDIISSKEPNNSTNQLSLIEYFSDLKINFLNKNRTLRISRAQNYHLNMIT